MWGLWGLTGLWGLWVLWGCARTDPMTKRQRELARRLKELGAVSLANTTNHGVSCPKCGYVFTQGFVVPNAAAYAGGETPVTVCTRCRRRLMLDNGKLREINAAELLLLTNDDRNAFAFMDEIARLHMEDQS